MLYTQRVHANVSVYTWSLLIPRLEKEIKKLEADIAQEKQAAEGLMSQMVTQIIDDIHIVLASSYF